MSTRRTGLLLALATALVSGGTASATVGEKLLKVLPYCNVVLEPAGKVLVSVGKSTPHPVVKGAAFLFEATELSLEAGEAAVEAHEFWLEGELLVVGEEARKLHDIKASGGDLNGPEATQIKTVLRHRQFELGNQREGAFGYTMDAIAQHWGYVAARMSGKKLFELAVGGLLKTLHIQKFIEQRLRVPKQVNWALNYGGPLEQQLRKGAGWSMLGARARLAEAAASDAIIEQEAKLVAYLLHRGREQSLKMLSENALGAAYVEALRDSASASRPVMPADFRLIAARAVDYIRPAPVRVEIPQPVPAPIVAVQPADQLVQTIANDDVLTWHYEATPSDRTVTVPHEPPPEPAPDPEPEPTPPSAWALQLEQEWKQVGDGKTFQVCSNGCSATSDASWTGARGQTLSDR
ncbi:MAG: hypothetical protein NT117_03190 [Gammaproteobacteria bacterium]|nr:hypothetical protein [Gammaproteobacteria bacterium]